MTFELSSEQIIIKETIRDFVLKECPRDMARELEEKEEIPEKLWTQISDLGFFGLTIPEEYGGEGESCLAGLVTTEELAVMAPPFALAYSASAFSGGAVISRLGDQQQKEAYLEKLARGELVFTAALNEEEKGFNMAGIKTTASLEGSELVLNGTKRLVSLAGHADYCLVLANSAGSSEDEGSLTMVIVDTGSAGIQTDKLSKIGMKSLGVCDTNFNDVRVPVKNILGGSEKLNCGTGQIKHFLDIQNLSYAACQLGIARGAYEYAKSHAKERVQFGSPIVKFSAVQEMLVNVAMEIEACRLLVYRAGALADSGEPFSREAGIAVSYALRIAKKAASQGLQICGGYGYALEYDAQRYLRDAYAVPANGQTTETINERIAMLVGL